MRSHFVCLPCFTGYIASRQKKPNSQLAGHTQNRIFQLVDFTLNTLPCVTTGTAFASQRFLMKGGDWKEKTVPFLLRRQRNYAVTSSDPGRISLRAPAGRTH
jgi:hypothetical protein